MLGLIAWPLVARVPQVAQQGHWRPDGVAVVDPVPTVVSLAALAALAWMATRVLVVGARLRRERRQARRLLAAGPPLHVAGRTVMLVEHDEAVAFAVCPLVPGSPSGIVISTALVGLLDHDELCAVVAHEHAHLRHRHGVIAAAATVAAAWPGLRTVSEVVVHLLERWADENAATTVERRIVARALAARRSHTVTRWHPGRSPRWR